MLSQEFPVGSAHVQPTAGSWRSACAGRREALGVKGESPLARAVFAENFAVGNSFRKHGCRACLCLTVLLCVCIGWISLV
jgi:hypothetical protein